MCLKAPKMSLLNLESLYHVRFLTSSWVWLRCLETRLVSGRKTAWSWRETSPSSIASRKTAANTSWSLTRPPRKTAATTRSKPTAMSRWLNSWCRVSLSHAPPHTFSHHTGGHVASPLLACRLFLGCSGSCRCPRHSAKVTAVVCACQLKLEDLDHISPEGHRSARATWILSLVFVTTEVVFSPPSLCLLTGFYFVCLFVKQS